MTHKHIETKESLEQILHDIRARHHGGYEKLVDTLIEKIKLYHSSIPKISEKEPVLILGISGGIDSAVVAALAVRAIGAPHVKGMHLSSKNTSVHETKRAKILAAFLDIQLEIILLDPVLGEAKKILASTAYVKSHQKKIQGTSLAEKIRQGNFASRLRVAFLYDMQRELNGRVLGTANRTEYVQGYATKYGTPMSYDFGVLDELYKTDVKEIAKILNIPDSIQKAIPSTGFYKGQTHEKELNASLDEQDAAAFLLFEKRLDIKNIIHTYAFHGTFLQTMVDRYNNATHKRMLKQPHIQLGCIQDLL